MSKIYELYDIMTGDLAFTGSANECMKFVGVKNVKRIYNMMDRSRNCVGWGYQFVEIDLAADKVQKAIQAWDAFVEPIRERFGIAVYKGEVRNG